MVTKHAEPISSVQNISPNLQILPSDHVNCDNTRTFRAGSNINQSPGQLNNDIYSSLVMSSTPVINPNIITHSAIMSTSFSPSQPVSLPPHFNTHGLPQGGMCYQSLPKGHQHLPFNHLQSYQGRLHHTQSLQANHYDQFVKRDHKLFAQQSLPENGYFKSTVVSPAGSVHPISNHSLVMANMNIAVNPTQMTFNTFVDRTPNNDSQYQKIGHIRPGSQIMSQTLVRNGSNRSDRRSSLNTKPFNTTINDGVVDVNNQTTNQPSMCLDNSPVAMFDNSPKVSENCPVSMLDNIKKVLLIFYLFARKALSLL